MKTKILGPAIPVTRFSDNIIIEDHAGDEGSNIFQAPVTYMTPAASQVKKGVEDNREIETTFFHQVHADPNQPTWDRLLIPSVTFIGRNSQPAYSDCVFGGVQFSPPFCVPAGGPIYFASFQLSIRGYGKPAYQTVTSAIAPGSGLNWLTYSAAHDLGLDLKADEKKTTLVFDVCDRAYRRVTLKTVQMEFLSYSSQPHFETFILCRKIPPVRHLLPTGPAYQSLQAVVSPLTGRILLDR